MNAGLFDSACCPNNETMLKREIDVENQEALVFLRDLTIILYRARTDSPEYGGVSSLLRLMWSVYAGWNFIEGHAKSDVIADMIEAM